jgi:hypothetical protein
LGLSIVVGLMPELRGNNEALLKVRRDFVTINKLLKLEGLPYHHEPALTTSWSWDLVSYDGLYALKRFAASIWSGIEVPASKVNYRRDDAIIELYLNQLGKRNWKELPLPFFHLICHSDCEGYYVPIDFRHVIYSRPKFVLPGAMLGSVQQLLHECEILASILHIPRKLDPESDVVWSAIKRRKMGKGWRRYPLETHSCLQLMAACRRSLKKRAALAFT